MKRPRLRNVSLRQACRRVAIGGVLGLGIVATAVSRASTLRVGGAFAGLALATWSLVVVTLARFASESQEKDASAESALGPATQLTLLRGFLASLLSGFILSSPPSSPLPSSLLPHSPLPSGGVLPWMPGLLYSLAALSDRYDGILARRLGQVTDLGGRLDVAMDGLGLLVASVLAVRWHRLPLWYLAVGLAYPVFHAGLALRRWLDWPVYRDRLRPRRATRFFAGVQMVVCAVALLLPNTGFLPATTYTLAMAVAATLAMLPTLVFFVRDWLLVVGRWPPSPTGGGSPS